MRGKISHNLTQEELTRVLTNCAIESDIGEELLKAVKAKVASVDLEPKEPRYPAMKHIYRIFMQQHQQAMKDIEGYAKEIILHGSL